MAVLATRPVWPTLRCQQNWQTLIWTVWACSRCPKSSKIENRKSVDSPGCRTGTWHLLQASSGQQWPTGRWSRCRQCWNQICGGCKSIPDTPSLCFFLVCFTLGLGLFKRFGRDNRDMKFWFAKRASDKSKYKHLRASNLVPAEAWNQMAAWSGFAGGRVVTFTRGHEFVI